MPALTPALNLLPRWRTMMLPAITGSPPNFFSPSRFDSESRPLRVEPPAFLCAMVLLPLLRDPGDLHFREVLPVTLLLVIVLAAAMLDDADLVAAAVRHDLGGDLAALDQRRAHGLLVAVGDQQHFLEGDGRADIAGQALDLEDVAGGDLVLLATGLDDGVHRKLR